MISIINRSFGLISCPFSATANEGFDVKQSCLWVKNMILLYFLIAAEGKRKTCLRETMTPAVFLYWPECIILILLHFLSSLDCTHFHQRDSNYFKTCAIRRANQWQECEVTRVTYYKKLSKTVQPLGPASVCVCACVRGYHKWDVIVLTVCLGLQHTLQSGWFDL